MQYTLALLAGMIVFGTTLKLMLEQAGSSEPEGCQQTFPTFRISADVDLYTQDSRGNVRMARAKLIGISDEGARLRCKHRLEPGRTVFMRAHRLNIAATCQVYDRPGNRLARVVELHFQGPTIRLSQGPVQVEFASAA